MQMARKYILEVLAVAAIIVFGIIFLYTSLIMKNAEFAGTDDIAAARISGSPNASSQTIKPLIPQWVPPSPEIESTLFGLQAAIGGMVIGGVFGYWIGQKKKA